MQQQLTFHAIWWLCERLECHGLRLWTQQSRRHEQALQGSLSGTVSHLCGKLVPSNHWERPQLEIHFQWRPSILSRSWEQTRRSYQSLELGRKTAKILIRGQNEIRGFCKIAITFLSTLPVVCPSVGHLRRDFQLLMTSERSFLFTMLNYWMYFFGKSTIISYVYKLTSWLDALSSAVVA